MTIKRITLALFLLAVSAFGADNFHAANIIPKADHSAVGSLTWRDQTDAHGITLYSPSSLAADISYRLPGLDGSSGQALTTDGSGHLAFGNATLVPPFTISGTTTGDIFTVQQLGTGNALIALGPSSVTNNSSTSTALSITQLGTADALHVTGPSSVQDNSSAHTALTVTQLGTGDALHITGNSLVSGFLSQSSNNWTMNANGLAFAQDYTARYVFNSIGDVPQTGTVNTSGTTVTATSGTFDQSFVGGQLLICAGGCTGLNGSLFLITHFTSPTQVTVATTPGTLTGAGYSYQANAFQTSTGRMQITGTGDGLFQSVVVNNGLTSNGGGALTGTATWSGNDVLWASGSKFNPSMVGGSITVGATTTRVTGFVRDTHVTVLASLGSSSGSFSITPNAFQTSNGNVQVDSSGNATFGGALRDTGGNIAITSSGSSSYSATGSSGGPALLMLAGNNSTNCWQNQANGSGSSLVLGYTSSCGGAFSPTAEVTFTPTGTIFAQPINVPSCSGCGGITYSGGTGINVTGSVISNTGALSFNTRTGSVSLTPADVTNAGALNTFAVTSTSDASLSAVAGTFANASLFLHGNNSTNCWDTDAGVGSSLLLKYASSCGGGYSPTTEVTYTPTGVTFAQPITVPSCTGCSSAGVSSFNSRTGAVSLTKSDVTAVTQALGTTDAPTFGGVTATFGFAVPGWGFINGAGVIASSNGATCSGTPTASFASSFGIVTHC